MFHLAVVPEKCEVIDGGLDPENEPKFVVQLERHRSHRVFDPCSFDPDVEPIPHLAFVLRIQLATEESRDVVRLHRMDCGSDQVVVDGRQIRLPVEHNVGGILALIDAPVILHSEAAEHRTVLAGELIQARMKPLGIPAVNDLLGAAPVGHACEGIVHKFKIDVAFPQLRRQPVMPVKVDLQPAWQPRRDPHVAQSELLVHEIEVVMQALAVIGQKVRPAGLLVMPWLIRRARLHHREHAYQSRVFAPCRKHLFYTVLLAHIPFAQEFDRQSVFRGQSLRVLFQLITKRLSETRVVENPDLPRA